MVACAVPTLGKTRPVCFALPVLFKADESLKRGDMVSAGCYLREAVRRYSLALCEYHECWPKRKRDRSTIALLKSLIRSRILDKGVGGWLIETVEYAHEAAHCKHVRPGLIEFGIWVTFETLGTATEIEQPIREGGAV